MTAIMFDTYETIRRLTAEGVLEQHAAAIVDAIKGASAIDLSHLATKEDLQATKVEIKAEMKAGLAEQKAELVKWMFAGFIALGGFMTVLLQLPRLG